MSKTIASMLLCCVLFFVACKGGDKKDKLASYVSKNENGLTKKISSGSTEIVSQLIPDESGGDLYKFMVYVNTTRDKMSDSVLYYFNYRSADYFRLVSGKDTLQPVLSERVANGRREINQFTVLFDMNGKEKLHDSFSLVFLGNKLFSDSLAFHYALTDIKKASKSLYGYE